MTNYRKSILFYALTLAVTVGLIEALLSVLAWASPKVNQLLAPPWNTVSDERLGHRPSPGVADHDRRGWRNPKAYERADIVALGDSQTYGENVDAKEIWPRQLEAMTSRSVYEMAYGGYGPVHSLLLWDEAAGLKPRVVVEAFYSGNDLYDAFNIVYNRGRLPELKSTDACLREEVEAAEKVEPISQRVTRLFRLGRSADPTGGDDPADASPPTGLRAFLGAHSEIFGLVRRTRFELRKTAVAPALPDSEWDVARAFALQNPACCEIFSNGASRTILTSEYRLSALNLDDPRIAEGLRLSLEAINRMHQLASANNIALAVVLIPTKELVFREQWKNPSKAYLRLMENEDRMWRTTREYLDRRGIAYVDALADLRKQLAKGRQPYPVTQDGHPNRYGQLAIAQAAEPLVRKLAGTR